MKKEIINLIKILGIGYQEIVCEIRLDLFTVDSLEIVEPDTIILHHFSDDGFDWELSFDELEEDNKVRVLSHVNALLYN